MVWVGTSEFEISPISPKKTVNMHLPIFVGLCGAELGRSFGVSLLQFQCFFGGFLIGPLAVLHLKNRVFLFFFDFKSPRSNVS